MKCPIDVENHIVAWGELTGRIQSKDEKKKTPLYLCCDICEESNVLNSKMPVIRQIIRSQGGNITSTLNNLFWLKVSWGFIKRIKLHIADINGDLQQLSNCLLNGALIFQHEETYSWKCRQMDRSL